MTSAAVVTTELSKRYGGDVLAVDGVSLRVARGELYGLLGLNGAGKSTTIRMLLGMIRPTSGSAEVLGQPARAEASNLWGRVGHLVESATAYPELTVRENLDVARRLLGVHDSGVVGRAIDRLGLGPYRDRRARTLSLGNLQRLALARAVLHAPELLVLDEPANGLDPAGVVEVRELLRELVADGGSTIFMSSHILAEVDLLATRIGVVHRGRLIEELDSEALRRHRDPRLEVAAPDIAAAEAALAAGGFAPRRLESASGFTLELREPRALAEPETVAATLAAAGTPPSHLAIARETLEDHFIRVTSGEVTA
jgi:ABC-2 type transport system ATP-binding protein